MEATDSPFAEPAAPLRSVPDVNEAGHTPEENRSSGPVKEQGDPVKPAKKTAAKKTAAKKAAAAKKGPAAKKAAATPADVAKTVEAAVAEDPKKTAATPAKKASATKVPAKKASAAKKAAPGDKLPTKKAAAKETPVKETPKPAEQVANGDGDDVTTPAGTPGAALGSNPSTAEQDLNQPGTEGIVEGSTAKAIASETETLRKAADRNPE